MTAEDCDRRVDVALRDAGLDATELDPASRTATRMATPLGDCVVDNGRATLSLSPDERLIDESGAIASGALTTALETTMTCAIQATLPTGWRCSTQDIHVRFLRPVLCETSALTCEATIVHRGRRMATAEGSVTDADGRLYARGTVGSLLWSVAAA